MASSVPTFGLWYDFRNPARWRQAPGRLYRETIDQAVWVESLGFGSAWISEHHFSEDDYASSPLTIAAALSLMTGGRLELGVGLGYHETEFAAFGRQVRQRPSLLEDSIAVIRRAWSGSAERYEGRRFSSPGLPVTPVPELVPRLLVGAQSEPGIDRAARLGDGVITLSNDNFRWYTDALERHGRDLGTGRIYASQWVIVAEDAERVWAEVGERALYQMNEYIAWGSFEGPDQPSQFPDAQALLDAGVYRLMDASSAVEELVALATEHPQVRDFHYWAQLPGEPVESGSARIQYLADHVIPQVNARLKNQLALV